MVLPSHLIRPCMEPSDEDYKTLLPIDTAKLAKFPVIDKSILPSHDMTMPPSFAHSNIFIAEGNHKTQRIIAFTRESGVTQFFYNFRASTFDRSKARTVYLFGLIMRVRQIVGFTETKNIEERNAISIKRCN